MGMYRKKCLVIGATSFIGVYLVNELLARDYLVVATGRNLSFKRYFEDLGVEYYYLDLDHPNRLDSLPGDVDFVCHLAGRLPANSVFDLSRDDDSDRYIKTNVLGVISLLEWCRKQEIPRVISTTSYADVQNLWNASAPIKEDWPRSFKLYGDHAAYVISKNAASDFLTYYNKQYGMKNAIFRLPPVYGCGPHESLRVNGKVRKSGIGLFIDSAKKGQNITVYGDAAHAIRDIVYVKDVASAFINAGESSDACGLYNIGSGKTVSLLEQAQIIADVFAGSKATKSVVKVDPSRENGIQSYSFCIKKAKEEINYKPVYADFKKMMLDWKFEEERGVLPRLFAEANACDGGSKSYIDFIALPFLSYKHVIRKVA